MKYNILYEGDCLEVMRVNVDIGSVDLIYLDPPFFTGKIQKGKVRDPGAMPEMFDDRKSTWKNNDAINAVRSKAPESFRYMKDLDLACYLYYMHERLLECKRVLKHSGSIYLHCDWHASHWLRVVMDEVFGPDKFRNEIVWHYQPGTKSKHFYGRKHDVILFYTKSNIWTYNQPRQPSMRPDQYKKKDANGDRYQINGQGNRYYLKDGRSCDDVWSWAIEAEYNSLSSNSSIRTGDPTQKPPELLKRIILASSNYDDVVMDPFVGSGTAVNVARKLHRRWIGIDIDPRAFGRIEKEAEQTVLNILDNTLEKYNGIEDLEYYNGNNGLEFENWVRKKMNLYKTKFGDRGVDGIDKNGCGGQMKLNMVTAAIVSKVFGEMIIHKELRQPVERMFIVSRDGFDTSANNAAGEYKDVDIKLINIGDSEWMKMESEK